jgi:uncharacterized alpha/beta hydrolase family protein
MNKSSHAYFYLIIMTLLTIFFIRADEQQSPYLPVVLVAGINGDKVDMEPMANLIKKYLPGVYIKNVEVGLGKITSFWNMHDQAEWLAHELYDDYNLRNGCNIIAHSQGGLTARYFLQRFNYPHVHNYISLGAPQRGINGIPSNIDTKYVWLNLCEAYVSNILYMPIFQKCVSFAGYWNDSLRQEDYVNQCHFLPYLNNEKAHTFFNIFKENITKLQNLVLIKASQEDIVEPVESCHFGFYKKGSMSRIEDLFESDIYKNDTLGLKELYESGRLHLKEVNCTHDNLKSDEQNFVENILPFLKVEQNTTQLVLVTQEELSAIEALTNALQESIDTLIDHIQPTIETLVETLIEE